MVSSLFGDHEVYISIRGSSRVPWSFRLWHSSVAVDWPSRMASRYVTGLYMFTRARFDDFLTTHGASIRSDMYAATRNALVCVFNETAIDILLVLHFVWELNALYIRC